MKPTSLILGLSAIANVALIGVLAFSDRGTGNASLPRSASRAGSVEKPPQVDPVALAAALGTSDAATADGAARLVAMFSAGDPEQLQAALRAAGLSEDLIRSILREQIASRYRGRIRAIQEAGNPANRPYWQNNGRQNLTAAQRAEIRDLQRAMREEIEGVLGPEPGAANRSGRFAYLPGDKAEQLALLDADYNELLREARESAQGFRLPSDRDAQELVQEERRRDIEALLTPEELAAFDQRNSASAQRVRNQFGSILKSEAEFLAIYQLQQAFDAQFATGGEGAEFNRRERGQAEELLRSQILAMLGPERTAQYAQQRDDDYQTMQAATQRLNLPPEATTRVLDMRAHAATESQRIAADTAMDPAQKNAALASLAATVRSDLKATMGAEGGEAFAQTADWLRALERGGSFALRTEGGVAISNQGRGGNGGGGRGGNPGAGPRGGGGFGGGRGN